MDNLIQRAAHDLATSRYAIALTGAGISTESGIPDFRGPSGIWTRDPEAERKAYQRYELFQRDPKAYWEERLRGPSLLGDLEKVVPNPGHHALVALERMDILKCIITQNVDNLHQRAGSSRVLDYHGNSSKVRCVGCNARYASTEFDLERLERDRQLPPRCLNCGGTIKADTVHFREPIPPDVAQQSLEEAEKCDVMLVCGTSAVVYPFANLPRVAKRHATDTILIEVNAEPTPLTAERVSDYLIQGKTGDILPRIVKAVKQLRKE